MDTCQVLALEGGGSRGIFTAAVAAFLESDLRIRLADHFDLVVGTSTGGIIALALGLGLSPREILEFYLEEYGAIFPKRARIDPRGWVGTKYRAGPLESALKRRFQKLRLGDSSKRLVLTSFCIDDLDTYLYKTAHDHRFRRDYKEYAWKVARATSAAPTYFPAYETDGRSGLVDGGVWANNPAMVGLTEAVAVLGVPLEGVRMLTLGTLQGIPKGARRALHQAGNLRWSRDIATVLMAGQAVAARDQSELLLTAQRCLRFSPPIPEDSLPLDTADAEHLLGMAERVSRKFAPEFEARFCAHKAPVFDPVYKLEGT